MYAKLNPLKLGLAGGIFWGIALFILTWIARYTGWGMFWLSQWMDIYPGYDLSGKGSVMGLIWGFIHGFIVPLIFGWLYNILKPQRKKIT